jgi:hypothetical protein
MWEKALFNAVDRKKIETSYFAGYFDRVYQKL